MNLLELLHKGTDDDVRFKDIIQLTPANRCFDAFGSLPILSAWGSLELPSICSILSWSRNPFTVTFLIINFLKSETDITFKCKFVSLPLCKTQTEEVCIDVLVKRFIAGIEELCVHVLVKGFISREINHQVRFTAGSKLGGFIQYALVVAHTAPDTVLIKDII